jgi:hypothetical protein
MKPNIFEMKFFLTFIFLGLRRIFNPQKVKNIVTFLPMAAAAFAIMKDAIALSKSPEKTIIFFASFAAQVARLHRL